MNESKLIKVFLSLTKKEHRKFKIWLLSPAHNEHEQVQHLFDFLYKKSTFNAKTLSKDRIWKYLYSNKTYDDLRLRHLMSIALEVLSEFVRYYKGKNNTFFQEKLLVEAYVEKKLDKAAEQGLKKVEKIIAQEIKNEQFYLHSYELEVLKFELAGTQDRTRVTNITEITNHARLFFMITTLRYAYTALSHQNLKKTSYEIPLLEAILSEIKEKGYEECFVLRIYYHAYYTIKTPEDESHFQALKKYLGMDFSTVSSKEQRSILLIALNYSIKRVNMGHRVYLKEIFNLYKKGLEGRLLMENGTLSHFAYKNIVSAALVLYEYDWLEVFIPEYANFLEPKFQANYQHYSEARLLFEKGNLEQAMSYLVEAEYDDLLLLIGAKVMLIKLYYQQKYGDALDALLESFRVFLIRKKELSYHKTHYINLIMIVKKMHHVADFDKESILALKTQINVLQPLAERGWLLEEIDKL